MRQPGHTDGARPAEPAPIVPIPCCPPPSRLLPRYLCRRPKVQAGRRGHRSGTRSSRNREAAAAGRRFPARRIGRSATAAAPASCRPLHGATSGSPCAVQPPRPADTLAPFRHQVGNVLPNCLPKLPELPAERLAKAAGEPDLGYGRFAGSDQRYDRGGTSGRPGAARGGPEARHRGEARRIFPHRPQFSSLPLLPLLRFSSPSGCVPTLPVPSRVRVFASPPTPAAGGRPRLCSQWGCHREPTPRAAMNWPILRSRCQ
jgi:hypothetical protein